MRVRVRRVKVTVGLLEAWGERRVTCRRDICIVSDKENVI